MIYPSDLANRALTMIGHETLIGDLREGTQEARVALLHYTDTLSWLLSQKDWGFARQGVVLTLLKSAPPGGYPGGWTTAFPPVPWLFEYAFPPTAVIIRSVRPTPYPLPEFAPRVNAFVDAYDAALNQKVILTNLANAQAVFTAQVGNPDEWSDYTFLEDFVVELAKRLKAAFEKTPPRNAARDNMAAPEGASA